MCWRRRAALVPRTRGDWRRERAIPRRKRASAPGAASARRVNHVLYYMQALHCVTFVPGPWLYLMVFLVLSCLLELPRSGAGRRVVLLGVNPAAAHVRQEGAPREEELHC